MATVEWTAEICRQAAEQGWGLFDALELGLPTVTLDPLPGHPQRVSDIWASVVQDACVHRASASFTALAILREECPQELGCILRHARFTTAVPTENWLELLETLALTREPLGWEISARVITQKCVGGVWMDDRTEQRVVDVTSDVLGLNVQDIHHLFDDTNEFQSFFPAQFPRDTVRIEVEESVCAFFCICDVRHLSSYALNEAREAERLLASSRLAVSLHP